MKERSSQYKSILVTGGAGFIGSNFIIDWMNRYDGQVVNFDLLTYSGNLMNLASVESDPRYIFQKGDIGDRNLVKELLQRYQPDAIVNFAAESHVDRSIIGPEVFVETNVMGTFRLLDESYHYWKELKAESKDNFRFLHVSTDEVYGSLNEGDPLFTESRRYEPNSPYSASKAASDHFARAYHHTYGFPVVTTNCSNNYGPYQFPEKLVPLIITNALSWLSLPIYGDGLNIRDWLYVNDHCDAIQTVLAKGRLGETYNIGGINEMTNIDLVKIICNLLNDLSPHKKGNYEQLITYVNDRLGHDKRYAIDNSKISSELGWMPAETFETGAYKTVTWYLNNFEWVEKITTGGYRDWIKQNYDGR